MFRREKTEIRQKLAALSGVIALVTAVALGNWGSVISPPSAGPGLSPQAQSLLSGMIISQSCTRLPDGSLSLPFAPGSDLPTLCCVMQESPRDAKPLDEFSATVIAEKVVDEFLIVAETADNQTITLHRGMLYGTENSIRTAPQFGQKGHRSIAKACFSAKGQGESQTIRVVSAALTPSGK